MKKLLLPFVLVFGFAVGFGQNPADIETSFGPFSGFNGTVYKIIGQPDGKLLVSGAFTRYKGHVCNYFVRLLADGNVDPGFNSGIGFAGGRVSSAALQPDGKIIITGFFNYYNSVFTPGLTRLNSDGSIDTTFNVGNGFYTQSPRDLTLLPDNKIVIVGGFTSYNNVTCKNIIRLNTDASVDTTFNSGSGFNGQVDNVNLQSDGKMIVTGNFSTYNTYTRNRIARLNGNGTLDSTFSVGIFETTLPMKVLIQPDGKIVLLGQFQSYNNQPQHGLMRLFSNGTIDTSLNIGTGFPITCQINTAILDSSNNIIVGGIITGYNGVSLNSSCVRIGSDGVLDSSLSMHEGYQAYSILIQNDGKLVVGGEDWLVRTQSNGTLDTSFDFGTGFGGMVNATLLQPDGKLILGGGGGRYNLNREKYLMRLNPDGTIDPSFNLSMFSEADKLILQPDGKILAHGTFDVDPAHLPECMVRFNPDGSIDPSFTPNYCSAIIALQPDGKILIAGSNFSIAPEVSITTGVIRLNADGTFDPTFDIGTGFSDGDSSGSFNYSVNAITVQPDGKIIVVGDFTLFNGQQHVRIVRLLPNGSIDPSFDTGEGLNDYVFSVALQSDGKIIATGFFTSYNMIASTGIVRINTDGSFDTTFHTGTANYYFDKIAIQPDGKIITSRLTSLSVNRLIRYNADGSVDTGFDIGPGFSADEASPVAINSINVQSDGRIIVGGNFFQYQGTDSANLVRLWGGNNLSTTAFSNEKLVLYPNPTPDFLNLNLPSDVAFERYEIVDLTGKRLLQGHDSAKAINVQSLSKGMYFIKVKGQHAEEYNARFFKD